MQIQATKNAADFSNQDGNGNPTITTNEVRWEVIVQNGDTTILGGIFENTRTEVEKKVPFLSDIPIQNMNDQDGCRIIHFCYPYHYQRPVNCTYEEIEY